MFSNAFVPLCRLIDSIIDETHFPITANHGAILGEQKLGGEGFTSDEIGMEETIRFEQDEVV